ncbi:MAG: glycosyltransferase family 2 protein [Bacteroidetes bacterium]|nr:glycosyltransferase family 2 protein [Bacteroidota bacterium]MCL2303370.1 glycosyltransferase family 2 protein [Lentimicrobiaceae bacterium]
MRTTVALCITTYNSPNYLEVVLKSVLAQSTLPKEVIIADDGSGESTRLLVEQYKAIFPIPLLHCWHPDEGFRVAKIRNKAILVSQSDYLIFIDGDMALHPHFIRDHTKNYKPQYFTQGSRVLVSKEVSEQRLCSKNIHFYFFSKGITNRINTLSVSWLSQIITPFYGAKDHAGVRSCNLAFWKQDAVAINGFNEDFEGWGREDSEFVVRLLNNGVKRQNLKLGGVGFHIWHPESSKQLLQKNQTLLDEAIIEEKKWCKNGLMK